MKGYQVKLQEVEYRNTYYTVAVVAKSEEEAVKYAMADIHNKTELISIKTIEEGTILIKE